MTTPIARGRGRGRGNTLPAWMTHHGGTDDEGGAASASAGTSRQDRVVVEESNTFARTSTTSDHHRYREDDRRQRRQTDDDNVVRNTSGHDVAVRGYGRDQREWDSRERGREGYYYREESYHHRDRDRYQDRHEDDHDRMPLDSRRSGYSAAATATGNGNHRGGHHGLGYDEKRGRGGEQGISWERDRAGGSGRGRGRNNEMNFVRGHEVDRDGRDGHQDSIGKDYDKSHDVDSTVRANSDNALAGMGRGRGRGRGANINAPAWMTAKSGSLGPVSRAPNIYTNAPQMEMEKEDESMEMLLAQARQIQHEKNTKQENPSRDERFGNHNTSKSASTTSDEYHSKKNKSNEQNEAFERLQQQRQLEEAQEAAKKAAEDELRRMEQLRDEEEQRQLRALIEELPDDGHRMEDETSDNHKRNDGLEDEDDNNHLFEFETEEEREERLARKRREERRKKLKTIQVEEEATDANAVIVVAQPRNVAGIINSELNNGKDESNDVIMNTDATNSVRMDSCRDTPTTTANDGSTSNDSFDMFATDNATPSTNNVMTTTTKNNSKRSTSLNTNAQECDDAEGYYKATIGEIITLPKESGEEYYSANDRDENQIAQFRVLGIVGKGVFSSVIKCVEETNAPESNSGAISSDVNYSTGRVIAMKIIRNNEVMAKAAAKEMRILRMLCHQPTKPKTKTKIRPSKTDNGGDNGDTNKNGNNEANEEDDDDDGEERARENHHIVRLLDVDPNFSTANAKENPYSTSVYASPPPEFRSHCVFLFEFLPYNLREVLSKFGKNVGINLTAVRSYARQLLCALAHLERFRVVHADLKPDNILVSANFSTVKLADFGSAFFETDHDNDPTPYLVSRFYRPPEVILGLEYDRRVDLWSLAVSLSELFTGTVLFPGDTNNDMLVRFMDAMGPISHKMAKRHALSYTRMGLQPHFEVGITGGTYQLRKQDVDRVTGQPVCRLVNVLSAKADARLSQVLLRASKGGGASERVDVLTFADFLNRCLALDPARRLSVRDALKNEFFKKKKKKEDMR